MTYLEVISREGILEVLSRTTRFETLLDQIWVNIAVSLYQTGYLTPSGEQSRARFASPAVRNWSKRGPESLTCCQEPGFEVYEARKPNGKYGLMY